MTKPREGRATIRPELRHDEARRSTSTGGCCFWIASDTLPDLRLEQLKSGLKAWPTMERAQYSDDQNVGGHVPLAVTNQRSSLVPSCYSLESTTTYLRAYLQTRRPAISAPDLPPT